MDMYEHRRRVAAFAKWFLTAMAGVFVILVGFGACQLGRDAQSGELYQGDPMETAVQRLETAFVAPFLVEDGDGCGGQWASAMLEVMDVLENNIDDCMKGGQTYSVLGHQAMEICTFSSMHELRVFLKAEQGRLSERDL